MMAGWIVVHSYPQAERWADQQLRHRGYHTYLPLTALKRRDPVTPSLTRIVEQPLFARYLFVRFPGNWTPIRYCPGVYRIVSAAGTPNMASEADISAVRAAEGASRFLGPETTHWAPGAAVAPAIGPFRGHPAVITAIAGTNAHIAIMMFGQLRSLSVPLDCLTARDE